MTSVSARTGYDLVLATSRLPVELPHGDGHRAAADEAGLHWRTRAGDATSALRSVLAARDGAWVGWDGRADAATEPFTLDKLWLHPVPMSARERDRHLRGHCATTLAPLYHDCMQPPVFRRPWREAYAAVNERFARMVADVAAPGGVVWVHDYHLQMVPGYLRRLRSDLLIGFFLHSAFPPEELFLRLPMREQILAGILGADLVGFQQQRSVRNFVGTAGRLLGVPTRDDGVDVAGRWVRVGVHPMSVDAAEIGSLVAEPRVHRRANAIRASLGNPRTIFLSICRLTHADGLEQVFDAYAELLADRRLDPARTALVQVVVPDDEGDHERLRGRVDRRVGQINGTWSRVGRSVVHYLHQDVDRVELGALYLAADVMLATPLRAGMTLAAKEFVAARTDDSGQLIISEFAGGVDELPGALVVNPHDTDALKEAMLAAAAQTGRGSDAMRRMRSRLADADVNGWAGRFLSSLGGCVAATYRQPVTRPPRAGAVTAPRSWLRPARSSAARGSPPISRR